MKAIVTLKKGLSVLVFSLLVISFIKCTSSETTDFSEAPSSPETLLALKKGEGVVELSWVVPENSGKMADGTPAPIVEYTVEFSKFQDFTESIKQVSSENSLRISELEENGMTYYFRVAATNSSKKSKGSTSSVVSITLGTVSKAISPTPPESLSVNTSSLSGSTATLFWLAPLNFGKLKDGKTDASVETYKIEYSKSESFASFKEVLSKDTSTAYVLGNLSSLTQYFVRVLAKNNSGDESKKWSQPSEVAQFRTLELNATPPAPPTNFAIKGVVSDTSATVTWLPPKDKGTTNGREPSIIVGYEIEYSPTVDFSVDTKTIILPDGSLREATIKELTPYRNYYARIRAINGNTFEKKSLYSLPIQGGFMTTKLPGSGKASRPSPPFNLNVPPLEVDETRAIIFWSEPENFGKTSTGGEASIIQYVLEYADNKNFRNKEMIVINRMEQKSRIINGLKVSTTYYVRIKTKNNNEILGLDESQYAVLVSGFKTLTPISPSVPSNPNVILKPKSEKTSVVFFWDFDDIDGLGFKGDHQTKAIFQGFELQYSIDGFRRDINKVSISQASQRRIEINDLTPHTQYDFRIRAYNDNNVSSSEKKEALSDWTNSISITTKKDETPPTSPTELSLTNTLDGLEARTSLKLSWRPPDSTGKNARGIESVITKYVIEYTSESFSNTGTFLEIKVFGDATSFIITDLSPNTLYKVRMRAINTNLDSDSKTSENTQVISKRTNDFGSQPEMPNPIKQSLEGVSGIEGIKFVWEDVTNAGSNPEGNNDDLRVVGYEYRVYKAADAIGGEAIVTETNPGFSRVNEGKNELEITGLHSNTDYVFEMISLSNNKDEKYKKSEVKKISFKTLVDRMSRKPSPPLPILGFRANSRVEITWDRVQNLGVKSDGTSDGLSLIGYKYRYYTNRDANQNPTFTETSNHRVLIENLQADTDYIFEIVTVSNHRDANFKESAVKTLEYKTLIGSPMITITKEDNTINLLRVQIQDDPDRGTPESITFFVDFQNGEDVDSFRAIGIPPDIGSIATSMLNSSSGTSRGKIVYTLPTKIDYSRNSQYVTIKVPSFKDYSEKTKQVNLTRPPVQNISVSFSGTLPTDNSVTIKEKQAFSAIVSPPNAIQKVEWSVHINPSSGGVNPSSAGTIDSEGLFTAGETPNILVDVRATSFVDATKSQSISFNIKKRFTTVFEKDKFLPIDRSSVIILGTQNININDINSTSAFFDGPSITNKLTMNEKLTKDGRDFDFSSLLDTVKDINVWYVLLDDTFVKAIQVKFKKTSTNIEVTLLQAKNVRGSNLNTDFDRVGIGNPFPLADSETNSGYGLKNLEIE